MGVGCGRTYGLELVEATCMLIVHITNERMSESPVETLENALGLHFIIAHQVLLSVGFSGQEYWSGLPCLPPGDLPDPGMEPESLMSPALAGRFFTTSTFWEAQPNVMTVLITRFLKLKSFIYYNFWSHI